MSIRKVVLGGAAVAVALWMLGASAIPVHADDDEDNVAPAVTAIVPPVVGTIVGGSNPAAAGLSLFVFGGGTSAALVAAVPCPTGTHAQFWSVDRYGAFISYRPDALDAAPNALWLSTYADGIPAYTALLGRCS